MLSVGDSATLSSSSTSSTLRVAIENRGYIGFVTVFADTALTEVRRLLAEHDAHSLTHAVEKEQAASSSRSIFGTFVYALGTYFAYNAAATLYAYRACGQAADRQLQEQGGEGTAEVTLHLKSWRSTAILEAPSGSDETRKVRVFPLLTLLPGRESQINCSKAGGWTRYSSGGFETTTSGKRPPETEV